MSEENREEILANFQSISGIDDVGEAFTLMEENGWDLMAAIQQVMPQDVPPRVDHDMESASNEASSNHVFSHLNNLSTDARPSAHIWNSLTTNNFNAVASTSADSNIADLASDIDLSGSPKHNNDNNRKSTITFNIHFNQEIYTIQLPSNATVEQLKRKIADATKVQMCRQALRGWPPAHLNDAQKASSKLSTLGLSSENELILIDLTEEGFMDFENDEVSQRLDKTFELTIVEQPNGKQTKLSFSGRTTIQEVKTNVFYVTDIPVRHQEWTGWPHGCDNNTTLAQSGIELSHNFILQNASEKSKTSTRTTTSSGTGGASTSSSATRTSNALANDTDSSADEFEDASDFNGCEEFFSDSSPVQPPARHLIQNNVDNESDGSTQFVESYVQRFGEPHPQFFIGSLEEALKRACHKPAKERKLLAIYLHHGESILANVFCDHLMKHESIIQTFAQNFVLYGWDLTYESNKHMFLSSITACVGNTASLTVRNIPLDKLPSILIIGKSRLSGRTSCEVLSVIHGNVGLDDLLSRLIESVEMYNEHLQVEIREEDERAARDQVKAEQDFAYQQTLQADMAKEAAKQQKAAAMAAERQRLESERAEQEAKKESIRLVAEQSLPEEPNGDEKEITKIRVRKPNGDFLERRFYAHNTLQDLLNFVASHGFLIDEYKLISSWPRRDLTAIDPKETLKTLNLFPQETVILDER